MILTRLSILFSCVLIIILFILYTTEYVNYVHWYTDNEHSVNVESNFNIHEFLSDNKDKTSSSDNYYNSNKDQSSSTVLHNLIVDKMHQDILNYHKKKTLIDKKKSNVNHHYGTSLLVTHDKYTTITNGQKKTNENGFIEEGKYDEQELKYDKHSNDLFDLPIGDYNVFGLGGLFGNIFNI